MILKKGHSTKYLQDYKDGLIPMGLGIGCDLDNHLVWKDSQLNFILGHDNVGKTYFIEWYFLALATNHNMTFTMFMDENSAGKVFRDLIQMYSGKPFMKLRDDELKYYENIIDKHFKFIDNSRRYSPDELIQIFRDSDTDSYLIDPYNALKMPMNYSNNYDVLNDLKMFCKQTKKTIYINAHPATASGRRGSGTYAEGHDFAGHIMPPVKADIEGGKPFANKADDFVLIHRLLKHATMWKYTMLEVDKIKDTDTGGKPTVMDLPILLDYNFGLGFKVNGKEVIRRMPMPIKQIKPNLSFSTPDERGF